MGAPVSIRAWWLWNQIPVTLGNLAGGFLFVGFPMLWMGRVAPEKATEATPVHSVEPLPDAVEA
jgi:formate transporter